MALHPDAMLIGAAIVRRLLREDPVTFQSEGRHESRHDSHHNLSLAGKFFYEFIVEEIVNDHGGSGTRRGGLCFQTQFIGAQANGNHKFNDSLASGSHLFGFWMMLEEHRRSRFHL